MWASSKFRRFSPQRAKEARESGAFHIVDRRGLPVDLINYDLFRIEWVALSLGTWSLKLYPTEKDRLNSILEEMVKTDGQIKSKREALLKIFSEISGTPEIIRPSSGQDLTHLCEIAFLQKIIDPKDGLHKWFCLRASRPDRKGAPILMGDGQDVESIEKLCQGCKDGWMWTRQQDLSDDHIEAIKRFGNEEIEAHLFVCNHPDTDYVQMSPNPLKDFLCMLTGNRQSIEKKCVRDPCPHLIHQTLKVVIKETPQYEELQKQIESKPKAKKKKGVKKK